MENDRKQVLYFEVPSDFKILRPLRESIANFMGKLNFSPEDINNTLIALNEAISNVIEHSYDFDKGKIIIVKVCMDDSCIEFIVRDFGQKFDGNSYLQISAPELKKRGLGLYIIKRMMDEAFYAEVERGNELHMIKKIIKEEKV